MSSPSFYTALEKLGDQDVFLTLTPEVADFTSDKGASLTLIAKDFALDIPLPSDISKLKDRAAVLLHYLSGPTRIIMGWNLKELFSYMLGKLGVPFVLDGHIFDLRVIEWYEGVTHTCPETFDEARQRLGRAVSHPSWSDFKNILGSIYNPLITQIIPQIETTGVMDSKLKKKLHAHYVLDVQANGRLICNKDYKNGYNPHSTSPEDRANLNPPFFDYLFLYLDYKNMEVSMLQWLSQDPALAAILDSGKDFYSELWKVLTGMEADDFYRGRCKGLFLPVVYGMGYPALAKKWEIPEDAAKKLIDRIYKKFPVALAWVKNQQDSMVGRFARDIHGRVRTFDDKLFLVRNYSVASPSTLACLDALVRLHHDIKDTQAKLVMHIHDGYMLAVPQFKAKTIQSMAIKSLETESSLFPGLRLKVSSAIGKDFGAVS